MTKFEVGKTYKHHSDTAIATVLKRTDKTLVVKWCNGYFGGQKRVKFRTANLSGGVEYFYIRNYKSQYAFFADNAE